MGDSRFDDLSRLFGHVRSRRYLVRAALGTFTGAAVVGTADASATTRRSVSRPGGYQCTRDGHCCTGRCTTVLSPGARRPRVVCSSPTGQTLCGTRCVDLDADPRTCGACGKRCKGGESCCDGVCAAIGSPAACAARGDRRSPGDSCVKGECTSICVEGPGIDARCENVATTLGTATDCGDACAAGEICYPYLRDPDGTFLGAVCCDCTDRCGSYCDGLCPGCPNSPTSDANTNTWNSGLRSAVPENTKYFFSTDFPPQYFNAYGDEEASAWWYNTPVAIKLEHDCTQSTDCTAICPASINHPDGYAADGCFCAKAKCFGQGIGDGGTLAGDWAPHASAGGVAGKYYCFLHLKKP